MRVINPVYPARAAPQVCPFPLAGGTGGLFIFRQPMNHLRPRGVCLGKPIMFRPAGANETKLGPNETIFYPREDIQKQAAPTLQLKGGG